MKIQIMSDIHAEFHPDGGHTFVKSLTPKDDTQVLVIAGDFCTVDQHRELVPYLLKAYPHVVMVCGNHTYYNSDYKTVWKELDKLSYKYDNFHVLENSSVTIEGQRFIGATMWFPDTEEARPYQRKLNDFHVIKDFKDWVFELNAESVKYLTENVKSDDVVVTHHIPSFNVSSKKWVNSPLQPFYVCDMEKLIADKHPKLWVFGHTHDSYDSEFECSGGHKTRLICNPFGYSNYEENYGYQDDLVIEV